MSKISLVVMQNGQQFDLSDLVISVKWSGRKGTCTRFINTEIVEDVVLWKQIGLEFEAIKGLKCVFSYDDVTLFKGLVTDTSQSNNATMSFTAYDYGIYLANSGNTFTYTKKTLKEIVIDCCKRAGVGYDFIADTNYKIPDITKPTAKYWDVIQSAMQATTRHTGKNYFVQFSDNECHLFERKEKMIQWVVSTQENIINWNYTSSIQQTKTRVKLIDSKKKTVATKIDEGLEKLIGCFQDIQQPDDDNTKTELEKCAERLLNAQKISRRSLSLTSKGITEAISGYCIYVMIDRLDWGRSFFIDEDTHTFKGDDYQMTLKINVCGENISENVSSILEDYKKTTSSSSSSSNSNSSKAEKLFAVCKSLVGTKYKMGGNSPGKYMDCSHYVAYCFQKCGVSNKVKSYGTAANLYALSTKVNKSQLQEGDIIFFKNKGSNHIGIYAGNNKMWNCYSGHGVGLTPLSYGGTIAGYGRLW